MWAYPECDVSLTPVWCEPILSASINKVPYLTLKCLSVKWAYPECDVSMVMKFGTGIDLDYILDKFEGQGQRFWEQEISLKGVVGGGVNTRTREVQQHLSVFTTWDYLDHLLY